MAKGGCGRGEEACSAAGGTAAAPHSPVGGSPPGPLPVKQLEGRGVVLRTEGRCSSSVDSWENLPESPVSWLPSLFAECSVSAATPKGLEKLAV